MGMFLRRGPAEKPVHGLNVVISGTLDASRAYAQIDGTKYTSAGTYQIPAGAEITVVCGASSEFVQANGFKITQNGTTVAHGTGTSPISYTLSLTMPVEIAFTKHTSPFGSGAYWSCEITTS